jgi:hypothetical protein
MRVVLQIVLFIFLAPICCAFGTFGGCLLSSMVPGSQFVMPAAIITGIVGGLVVAGLVVWSIRPGRV